MLTRWKGYIVESNTFRRLYHGGIAHQYLWWQVHEDSCIIIHYDQCQRISVHYCNCSYLYISDVLAVIGLATDDKASQIWISCARLMSTLSKFHGCHNKLNYHYGIFLFTEWQTIFSLVQNLRIFIMKYKSTEKHVGRPWFLPDSMFF